MVCLETNRDHTVIFEVAPKYCILDSFVDYDDYSSKMVEGVKSHLGSKPIPARDTQRAQTYLVCTRTQRPHRD